MTSTARRTTGDQLAVVSQTGPTVTFFDAATHERLDVLPMPAQPHELCFDPDHRLLYCASTYRSGFYGAHQGRAHELTVIDADTRTVVDTLDLSPDHAPHGLALDRARARLYVTVEATENEPGGIVVIDTPTRTRVGRIPAMAPGPHWFALTPDGTRGYTTNKEAPFLSTIDLERGEFTGRIEIPGSEGLAVSRDGRYVYAAAPKVDNADAQPGIRVIDTRTATVVRTLPARGPVMPVHVTATGAVLAGEIRTGATTDGPLGRQLPGVLTVFAPDTLEPAADIPVGVFPLTITSSPDGSTAYVSGNLSSTVTVVDLPSRTVLATLEVDRQDVSGAHGLAYIPAPTA
ncbi:YncE family protein [Streptomyces pinistramenti]|uniref:YncE family protein n=1 Tax=Streptomyces pinistramenti TaxID=2884812 RepID=UPI001D090BFE|nr:YncE family protein [Streptomyces pinistramenti]MCB5910574.1 YncE family protein [Streptomyces pinistramenti]